MIGRSLPPSVATSVIALAFSGLTIDGSAQTSELQRGRTVTGTVTAGDTVRYTVNVGEDYFVFGEVDQISVDVIVRIVNPEGQQIARFDGLGRGGERFAGNARDGGIHEIQIIPDEDEAGDFAITLHRVEPIETNPSRRVDQLMARFDGDDYPGAAVRVWRNGRVLFSKAYGMANLAYGIPFEADTRTNIGSTSKQFTAFAIMLQADRGLLSLDDDIRKHIPELPKFDQTITVRHLITHTSGLREFLNLLIMTGRRLDRGDWIDRSELIDIVKRQPALQNEPGAEFNYNNTAFGLAAVIVERTSDMKFHEFLRKEVFEPLGMSRTMVRPSVRHIVPEMSEGYTPGDDGYLQIGDLGGAVGAGGIYSTVEDLQKWVENYANPRVGNAKMIEEMMTSFVLNSGDSTGYGYGLFIDEQRGLKRVHHGGADVAHRSQLAYYPEISAGVTTQSNNAEFNSGVAFQIAAAFFDEAMEPEEADVAGAGSFDPADYDPEDFDEFVGRYSIDAAPAFILTFTREDDKFYTQATGQPRVEILPTSDSSFALTVVEASVVFHRNEDGEVNGLTLHQNGENHATRIADEDEASEWAPTADELGDFVGRYFSGEIETYYTISLESDTLVVMHRRLDDAKLSPGEEKDSFSAGIMSFAFERDRNGLVIGFYLSNGRTRNVRFERVN